MRRTSPARASSSCRWAGSATSCLGLHRRISFGHLSANAEARSLLFMDQYTPRQDTPAKPLKPARVALDRLALCFALLLPGPLLSSRFTHFVLPLSPPFL